MPASDPLIGETWEMTDPATGQAAQAVVTEATPQLIRLVARLGRLINMPRRSFLLTWRFVQDAPAQICAFSSCEEPAYLQVNDLGNWVWVCPKHLPAHVDPLLPTDNPEDATALDRCPICRSSTTGATEREVEAFTILHCGSCDTYWVFLAGQAEDTDEARFEDGLRFGEHLQDVAAHLESDGLAVRALIGLQAWQSLQRTTGLKVTAVQEHEDGTSTRVEQTEATQFMGVQLTIEQSLGNSLVLLGERPRTGVQRLGGQPSTDEDAPESLPEEGSIWTNTKLHLRVDRVGLASQGQVGPRTGQRLTIFGTVLDGTDSIAQGATAEYSAIEFFQWFRPAPNYQPDASMTDWPQPGDVWWERRTFRKITVQRTARIKDVVAVQFDRGMALALPDFRKAYSVEPPEPPCKVSEVWESQRDPSEAPFTIERLLETAAVVRRPGDDALREMPFYILATRYKKSTRPTALDRLMGDDED